MAQKTYKTANEMLNDSAKQTKVVDHAKEAPQYLARWGAKGLVASPLEYNEVMKDVPKGKILTTDSLCTHLIKKHNANSICPITSGIYINLCAKAAVERDDKEFPYWRTVRPKGELCEKFPDGIEGQKLFHEKEGHKVIQKGKRYFVDGYEKALYEIKEK